MVIKMPALAEKAIGELDQVIVEIQWAEKYLASLQNTLYEAVNDEVIQLPESFPLYALRTESLVKNALDELKKTREDLARYLLSHITFEVRSGDGVNIRRQVDD